MATNIKAVIFDMDGVLIDAKDWHYEALNAALDLFGLTISRQEHLTTYDGLPTKDKLIMLSKDKGLSTNLHAFINEMKQQYTMEIVNNKCKPMFHHEYALSMLKKDGYKMAVASNSIKNSIEVMMERAHLSQYLEFYVSNQDVVKGKPDPEMYNKAISMLGLKPADCVIVEDNENGIKAAKASGAHVLEVETVYDVNYANIKRFISLVENEG
ncbi:HAD family hydrolase [Pantoea agglomerans]|jgi:HAD superfamily hydrolase (TIGR01509 family)|uniref:HAD family hydrolase n=1 Tax=Enterobacter agglomerans TaxID=549 RepID=UPI0038064274